jgi:hypothetical protein
VSLRQEAAECAFGAHACSRGEDVGCTLLAILSGFCLAFAGRCAHACSGDMAIGPLSITCRTVSLFLTMFLQHDHGWTAMCAWDAYAASTCQVVSAAGGAMQHT